MTLRDLVADAVRDVLYYGAPSDEVADRIMALFEEERRAWEKQATTNFGVAVNYQAALDKAEARVKVLEEALGESAYALRRAWEMFDAICQGDPSTDRMKARDKAWASHVSARAALGKEEPK